MVEAIASCPANNIDPNQPLILPEEGWAGKLVRVFAIQHLKVDKEHGDAMHNISILCISKFDMPFI